MVPPAGRFQSIFAGRFIYGHRRLQGMTRVMGREKLNILNVSQMPASPPRFGAQARIHGLMTQLAKRHNVTAVALVDEAEADECRRHMEAYCDEVILIPNPNASNGARKRLRQLGSLVSPKSFERMQVTLPATQPALDKVLRSKRFDVVNLEFTFLGGCHLRQAPAGEKLPVLIVDSHNIDYELARQYARFGSSAVRRLYASVNWRKLRREELGTYRNADGVYLCSVDDERRLHEQAPGVLSAVIPNAADVDYFKPVPSNSAPARRTIVFFGLMSYIPNIDGIVHFVRDIWPRIAAAHPDVDLKIIGGNPPASVQALAGPRIQLTGFVPDLRPHLAEATALVVPLRIGGGTRLKIVEGMAMGKAIVSTTLGAEGIEALSGRDLLIADQPDAFADAVIRLLDNPDMAAKMGQAARELAVERYSWSKAASALEDFYRHVLAARA
jgi:glycosyltransferase involved in cell wall biosynthesis